MHLIVGFALVLFLGLPAHAASTDTCLEKAQSLSELQACTSRDLQAADRELQRVYALIKTAYAGQEEVLAGLEKAELAWISFRDAEYEARFPGKEKEVLYGSSHRHCSGSLLTGLTLQRIAELKIWLRGIPAGDVCAGAIQRPEDLDGGRGKSQER